MTSPRPPLLIRLRNWVGDVTLGIPLLQRLDAAGFGLRLVGRCWAADLLRGHGWPVEPLAGGLRARVGQWRALRRQALAADPGFDLRLNALCLPLSFSSALEMRLAGLRAVGYAHEGRSPLLARRLSQPAGGHELETYWRLGNALLGGAEPAPPQIGLQIADADAAAAQALLASHGVGDGFIVVCPFAGGTWVNQDKTWPGFAEFVARDLPSFGRRLLICPGPGEEAIARERFPGALTLAGVPLGVYASLLQRAALVISNDTGPGHIAAAVGVPTLSVLGPSDPARWRPWGPTVHIAQSPAGWPDPAAVRTAVAGLIG
jgi:heptosyltransferase-2